MKKRKFSKRNESIKRYKLLEFKKSKIKKNYLIIKKIEKKTPSFKENVF